MNVSSLDLEKEDWILGSIYTELSLRLLQISPLPAAEMGEVEKAALDAGNLVCLCYAHSIPESIEDAILVDKAKMVAQSFPIPKPVHKVVYLLYN